MRHLRAVRPVGSLVHQWLANSYGYACTQCGLTTSVIGGFAFAPCPSAPAVSDPFADASTHDWEMTGPGADEWRCNRCLKVYADEADFAEPCGGEPPPPAPTCQRCSIELCEFLDAYYGTDPWLASRCSKCRQDEIAQ